MRIPTEIAVVLLLLPLGAAGKIVPVGTEFQVNSYTFGNQGLAAVAAGADGNFVMTWGSRDGQDGSGWGVFGQRYDSAGQMVGTEFQVNSYTSSHQWWSRAAAGAGGTFAVTWTSTEQDGSSWGVFGQRYGSAGQTVGTEFQVNSYTLSEQTFPWAAVGADGTVMVTWRSYGQDGHDGGVFGQRYDSAGQTVGTEFQVNSYTFRDQTFPRAAAGADGTFVVTWTSDDRDGSSWGVFGQRYDSAGQTVGTEFQVNSYTFGSQAFSGAAAGADGTFVVTWASYSQDGSHSGVFGQRYESAGQTVGTEFQVNSYTMGRQDRPTLAADVDGNFVVTWTSAGQDGSSWGVFGQRYGSAGQTVGTEFQVNSYTFAYQYDQVVAAGSDGSFVVAWASTGQDGNYGGVFGQRFAERCPAAPSGTCATAVKAQLQLKLNAIDTKDKLKWKFAGGPALGQADFGNPTSTATYALCIYDDGALAAALQIEPSASLWSPIGGKGYQYSDGMAASDGVTKMKLLGGTVPKLQLKGKGTALPMPTPVSGTRFFAQTSAVIAQLREVNGDCYATTFTDAETVKNTGTQYKAKK